MQTAPAGYSNPYIVAAQSEDVRTAFIRKTYVHLALAIAAFAALVGILLQIPGVPELAMKMVGGWSWLVVLGAFMAVSWIADKWANSATSQGMQYAGLGLYVVAEAIIFLPLLVIANYYATQVGGPMRGSSGKRRSSPSFLSPDSPPSFSRLRKTSPSSPAFSRSASSSPWDSSSAASYSGSISAGFSRPQ